MLHLPATPAHRRRVFLIGWTALALVPAFYIATQFAMATRNFPFWDEVDSAIEFLLKLGSGHGWREAADQFFALSNEHRTVTSRIIFAISYWLTGTVNFNVIGLLGNLFIVAACLVLVLAQKTVEPRVRLAVVLAFLVFQLEHFENFIWSGASIDHFQIILLAVGAITMLTRDTPMSLAWAALLALLATFTLAHGCVLWPIGALWFIHRRAWSRLAGWSLITAAALLAFFHGFSFNPGHNIPTPGLGAVLAVGHFWLQLVGAPLVLGDSTLATVPGVVLLAALSLLIARGALTKYPVAVLVALFGIGSLVLIAFGRIHMGTSIVTSRYMILGALAWTMVIFMLLEEATTPERPFRWLVWLTPALLVFNIMADVTFQSAKEAFIEVRDRAATYFEQYRHDGEGISQIHPAPKHADEVLAAASARGVYRFPPVSHEVQFNRMSQSTRLITYVDELVANDHDITIGGWAMIPGKVSKRGHVYLVLQSDEGIRIYSTLTLQRPDVARAYHEPRWRLCGFRAVIGRDRLPARNFRVGVMVAESGSGEYLMTDNQLKLAPPAPDNAQLASSH